MTIEKIKNWVKRHKKGVILAVGGTAAAVVGVKVFRDHYYIVPSNGDYYTLERHSIGLTNVPEAVKQLGDVDMIWENSKNFNVSISNVPWDKLGEAGKAVQGNYNVENIKSVGIVITAPK